MKLSWIEGSAKVPDGQEDTANLLVNSGQGTLVAPRNLAIVRFAARPRERSVLANGAIVSRAVPMVTWSRRNGRALPR